MTLDEFLEEVAIGDQNEAWAALSEAERAALTAEMEAGGLGGLADRLNLVLALDVLKVEIMRPFERVLDYLAHLVR